MSATPPATPPTVVTGVVFDLDGVLVDTEPVHFAATQAMLGRIDAGCKGQFLLTQPTAALVTSSPPIAPRSASHRPHSTSAD